MNLLLTSEIKLGDTSLHEQPRTLFWREMLATSRNERALFHFEKLPTEGVLLFSAWTKLSLNTEDLGYASLWSISISNYTFHFLGTCYKRAIVSFLGGNILHGYCWNFVISQKGKEGFLVPEHESQDWDTLDFTWISSRMCSSKKQTTLGQESNHISSFQLTCLKHYTHLQNKMDLLLYKVLRKAMKRCQF